MRAYPGSPPSQRLQSSFVHERGGFHLISDAEAVTAGEIWGVGMNGLVRYDGRSWHLEKHLAADVYLRALDAHDDEIWAVGDPCVVVWRDGGKWIQEDLPYRCALFDVTRTPEGTVWATGAQQTESGRWVSLILRRAGNRWLTVDHPRGVVARAIMMFSDKAGWVATSEFHREGKVIFLHWDGDAWLPDASADLAYPIRSLDGVTENDIWAVGGLTRQEAPNGVSVQVIAHYDGTSWSSYRTSEGTNSPCLMSVRMVAAGDGWAVGEHYIVYRLLDDDWRLAVDYLGLGIGEDFYGIAVVDSNNVWFVGNLSAIAHYHSGQFDLWAEGRGWSPGGLESISALSGGRAWAVGRGGPLVTRLGEAWVEVDSVPRARELSRVLAISNRDVWAAVSAVSPFTTLVHYDGESWNEISLPGNYPAADLDAVAADDIWVVTSASGDVASPTERGEILHYDGRRWRLVQLADTGGFAAIDMLGHDEGWAAGEQLMHYSAGVWDSVPIPPEAQGPVLDLAFVNGDSGWAITPRTVLKYEHGRWRSLRMELTYPQDRLRALAVTRDGEVWVAAEMSCWWWDGLAWSSVRVPNANLMPYAYSSVAVVDDGATYRVWLAGAYESIATAEIEKAGLALPTEQPTQPSRPPVTVALPVVLRAAMP